MLKVLVIGGEPPQRELYRRDLERDGYRVLTAGSSAEGLEILESASPDLVIVDAPTPDMDCLEAIGRLVAHCPRVPVVLCSAPGTRQGGFVRRAADAYVPKSGDTAALRRQIRKFLAPDAA